MCCEAPESMYHVESLQFTCFDDQNDACSVVTLYDEPSFFPFTSPDPPLFGLRHSLAQYPGIN